MTTHTLASEKKPKSLVEFIMLMAIMMSLVALCIDAMLPALSQMTRDLAVARSNDIQLVISLVFLGMAFGQLVYGPISDRFGRKPAAFLGLSLFVLGCLISISAKDLNTMLFGRVFQGFGLAGPRIVCMALIRDVFSGNQMARIMSYIMVVFILTPILAPAFGQAILQFWSWRAIFIAFLVIGVLIGCWFALRQPETLQDENRIPISIHHTLKGFRLVFSNPIAMGYTLAIGLISGAFLGYLNLSQPILQVQYGLGSRFSLVFGVLAAFIGAASFLNGRMVLRFGMRRMTFWASFGSTVLSLLFSWWAWQGMGNPDFSLLIIYLSLNLFFIGILFGNMNALAMEPLGNMAGFGAAVVGSVSTLMAIPIGILIGTAYHGSVLPLTLGFALNGIATTLILAYTHGRSKREDAVLQKPI